MLLKSALYPYGDAAGMHSKQQKKSPKSDSLKLLTGIEPVTSALPMRRNTDCATTAHALKHEVYYNNHKYPCQSEYIVIKSA